MLHITLPLTESSSNDNYDYLLDTYMYPDYTKLSRNTTLYHNTPIKNIASIAKGGLNTSVKRDVMEYEGDMIWTTSTPDCKGYGGCTVAFDTTKLNTDNIEKVNSDEFCVYQNVPPNAIQFIDTPVNFSESIGNYRLSDIPRLLRSYGEDKVKRILFDMGQPLFTFEKVLEVINS